MKKSLLTLLSSCLVILTSVGMVYAWSSAQGKVQGIGVSVGSSGLLVNGQREWSAGVNFDNILPGWISEPIVMTVDNVSEGMDLNLQARILFTGTDFTSLANTMEMAIEPVGSTTAPGYQTLMWWSQNGMVLAGGALTEHTQRDYQIRFKLPLTAGDEIQNKEVGISVLLTGTQAL